MTIDLTKLQTKLNALKNKNVDEIMSRSPLSFIPGLGSSYTKKELENWLQKRIDYIESCKTKTKEQIDNVKDTLYSEMNTDEKDIVDKILAGEEYELDLQKVDFNKISEISLYKFITEK